MTVEVLVSEIPDGHRAEFRGAVAVFQCSGGPNEWTKQMAAEAAVFFWILEQRRKAERTQP